MTGAEPASVHIDTSKPHPARMYDWFLGGKDNYPVDQEMAEQLLALDSRGREMARVNRAFMHRATRCLAESGMRQFLDVGTGIPTEPNLHQIAQRSAPDARIVYCDNDPIVLAHAAALLHSSPEGATDYIQADAREPATIIEAAGKILDFDRPIALSLVALLHFVADEDAYDLVNRLMEPLASGSCLVLSHVTGDFDPEGSAKAAAMYRARGLTLRPRSREETARFFADFELIEPGVSLAAEWRPELGEPVPVAGDDPIPGWVGVARKR
ncbi:SAM-dependent methyltransferase [Streptomyces sp. NBC_01387]|uniref:SAM-dependent methyltransferase n=1 Tax=unclassified Streptomyces TaxID=2593676 RepID=UPI0020255C4F|nr:MULTISPECIES: SAM-dependent methyltransferase [unclassified Streptomyces]MCX4552040.1 SAM-dependent methyltransferase [Streptomyces sp. NBC_01500]WSC23389.1 SAM-dependent methyltransferase [Streptomyces sp. NBC_01766]WSV57300.1 SAM-dependent methyltransferase [Streptomyces sp. NBC_01014]